MAAKRMGGHESKQAPESGFPSASKSKPEAQIPDADTQGLDDTTGGSEVTREGFAPPTLFMPLPKVVAQDHVPPPKPISHHEENDCKAEAVADGPARSLDPNAESELCRISWAATLTRSYKDQIDLLLQSNDTYRLIQGLKDLEYMEVDSITIKNTQFDHTIIRLRRHPDLEVQSRASRILNYWRALGLITVPPLPQKSSELVESPIRTPVFPGLGSEANETKKTGESSMLDFTFRPGNQAGLSSNAQSQPDGDSSIYTTATSPPVLNPFVGRSAADWSKAKDGPTHFSKPGGHTRSSSAGPFFARPGTASPSLFGIPTPLPQESYLELSHQKAIERPNIFRTVPVVPSSDVDRSGRGPAATTASDQPLARVSAPINGNVVRDLNESGTTQKGNALEDFSATATVHAARKVPTAPLPHVGPAERPDYIIRTLDEFLSLAKLRIEISEETFRMLKGPFTSFHAAVVVYLDEYARCRNTLTAHEEAGRTGKVLEESKSSVERCRSTFLKTCLSSVQSILTIATFSKKTTTPVVENRKPDQKQSENDVTLSATRLAEFEKTISDLKEKLEASEVLSRSLTLESDKVRKEKEWQHKAFEDQQRKLEGSFSQKVEERVTKRVREEQSAVAARLATAELKAHKYDAAVAKIDRLEKQISNVAHEKATWVATRLRVEAETKALREDNIAIQQGYEQVRQEKDEAELRIMDLEEQLGLVTADRDALKSNSELGKQRGTEIPDTRSPAAEIQIVANNNQATRLDRLTRIKEDLEHQYQQLREEQASYAGELEDVDKQIAIREVELAKLNDRRMRDNRRSGHQPAQLEQAGHVNHSGDDWRQKELKAKLEDPAQEFPALEGAKRSNQQAKPCTGPVTTIRITAPVKSTFAGNKVTENRKPGAYNV